MIAIRVLIVDDVTQVRQGLRTLLTLAGVADTEYPIKIVGEAANGLEAIRQADALQPDVVLMDLEMPVLDGYAAAERIKTDRPACRVIALTVHDYEEARKKAFQAKMDDFITKGASLESLVQVISGSERKE
jgi:DNA-binding NarL/FixJ family response regulator